jgi:hypothetical protein
MKQFGPKNIDEAPLNGLLETLKVKRLEPLYILHYARVPMNVRMCQQPGSLKVQAVLPDNKVLTVIQLRPDGPITIERNW